MPETTTPNHGDERNRSTERRGGKTVRYTDPTGAVAYDGPASVSERTVAERWCGFCRAWVSTAEVGWLFGFLLCPRCKHGWHETPEPLRPLLDPVGPLEPVLAWDDEPETAKEPTP
jgi:hypothetical protein